MSRWSSCNNDNNDTEKNDQIANEVLRRRIWPIGRLKTIMYYDV